MAHSIVGLIGSREALSALSERFGAPAPTTLNEDLQILPLSDERLDMLVADTDDPVKGFSYLTTELARALARSLGGAPALYVETEYFGGSGYQAAALLKDGEVEWADVDSDFDDVKSPGFIASIASLFSKPAPPSDPEKSPISQGLEMLGVVAESGNDEFDTVGLGRFRSLEALGIREH